MIRAMCENDFKEIESIENECFEDPYKIGQYEYEINDNPVAKLYVLMEDEKIIGFIDFWITFEACQLTKLAIKKEYQQKGYASLLMEYMIKEAIKEDCEAILLEVRESNKVAQKFYDKFNFIEMNVRKNYYSNHENAIVMGKVIGGLNQ